MASPLELQLALTLTICLVSTFVLSQIAKEFKLPTIIAPLLIGLILNIINNQLSFIPRFYEIVTIFANLGLILILFFLGLKINFRLMKDMSKNSSIMAINAGIVPFALGFYTTYLFGYSAIQSLFVGICLSITAEEVSISVLDEMKMIKKKIGQLIIEAGIIGDVFEIMVIAMLGVIIKGAQFSKGTSPLFSVLAELAIFLFAIIAMRYAVIPLIFNILRFDARNFELFLGSFIILLITVTVSELLSFGYVVGSLIAGLLLKDALLEDKLYNRERKVTEVVETVTFGFLEPLIFIWIGLSINIGDLFTNLTFSITLTIIALLGKVIGSMVGNYFCNKSLKEGFLVGWALNARGATELFAILIAKNQGIISEAIFITMVFVALTTTIVSPIIFKFLVRNNFGIHD